MHESLADFSTNPTLKGWVSGDEVVDTKPLLDEINKLKEENQTLKEKVEKSGKVNTTANKLSQDVKTDLFSELDGILRAIDIKLPENERDEGQESMDLLSLFYTNRDALINGVTNRISSSEAEQFFYHNLCPKLQVHGLIVNEKIAGVQYRRSYVSKLGNEFLAYLDKRVVLNKTKKKDEIK